MPDAHVLVLTGSARLLRRAPTIAEWVAEIGRKSTLRTFDVVDVANLGLTLDDEPSMPALGRYTSKATQEWSSRIKACGGVVVVTPQYNWGYPAPLKNALDHLHAEWHGKPAALITFGGHGGGKCGAQLRQVMEGALEMRLSATQPELKLPRDMVRADDGHVNPASIFSDQRPAVEAALRELVELIRQA
jgi:NAD(P)H-dependent FMN reductase